MHEPRLWDNVHTSISRDPTQAWGPSGIISLSKGESKGRQQKPGVATLAPGPVAVF
jgi:hypothetical protein